MSESKPQTVEQKAANYSILKANIVGKRQGILNALEGLDDEFINKYTSTRTAKESLPILDALIRLIHDLEK